MQERRMLIGNREDLSSWGTWKTGYELLQGDVIYGIALKSQWVSNDWAKGEYVILATTNSKLPRLDVRLLITNDYELTKQRPYCRLDYTDASIASNTYYGIWKQASSYSAYDELLGVSSRYNPWLASWLIVKTSSSAWGNSTFVPEGMYIPYYFGNSLVLRYNSGDRTAYGENPFYIYYNGGANTFILGSDAVLFLTSSEIS